MLRCIAGDFPQIVGHSGGQQVGADKVRRTVTGTLLVAPADITILLAGGVLVTLLVKDAAAVGTKEYAGECNESAGGFG